MAWLLRQRGRPLCTQLASRENPAKTVLYLAVAGEHDGLTLDTALCAYVLAYEGILHDELMKIVLVRSQRGTKYEKKKMNRSSPSPAGGGGGDDIDDRESRGDGCCCCCTLDNEVLRGVPIVDEAPDEVRDVKLPAVHVEGEHRVIAGLCASIRHLLLQHGRTDILGFRAACLAACAQVSLWTSFCERDMPSSLEVLASQASLGSNVADWFPESLLLLETHLRTPVRTHNEKHLRRILSVSELSHDFVEGTAITLSDLLLFYAVHLMLKELQCFDLEETVPLVMSWYRRMLDLNNAKQNLAPFLALRVSSEQDTRSTMLAPDLSHSNHLTGESCINDPIAKLNVGKLPLPTACLYSQSKANTVLKTCVKHKDATVLLGALDQCPSLLDQNTDYYEMLPWNTFPAEVRPESGGLPEERIQRKQQQISNVVNAVVSIVGDRSLKVVDFCSGGGHVAIVLAYLLPKCRVVLVENKYESLHRAQTRAGKLGLGNVRFYQCNLDQFCGRFDVAVSLHACGGATDLVVQKCLEERSSLVSVPCCYGAIGRAEPLHEALAKALQMANGEGKTVNDPDKQSSAIVDSVNPPAAPQSVSSPFELLCHFADRNENADGAVSMAAVDSDRVRYMASRGCYSTVRLTNILPLSCTPKNNMIVARAHAVSEPV